MAPSEYILNSGAEEFRRLRAQAEALAPEAEVMLDRIGIGAGWRCAELGCGAGGIMDLLSHRVGPSGHVLGLDQQQSSLEAARAWAGGLQNVSFHQASILDNDLEQFRSNANREAILSDWKNCSILKYWSISYSEMR